MYVKRLMFYLRDCKLVKNQTTMKKLLFLLILTASLSVTASANNEPDPQQPVKDSKGYTFSLNTEFLSLFSLFCITPAETDTLKSTLPQTIDRQVRKEN